MSIMLFVWKCGLSFSLNIQTNIPAMTEGGCKAEQSNPSHTVTARFSVLRITSTPI